MNDIPAHVASVIEAIRDASHKYIEGLNYLNDQSKPALEKALSEFHFSSPRICDSYHVKVRGKTCI